MVSVAVAPDARDPSVQTIEVPVFSQLLPWLPEMEVTVKPTGRTSVTTDSRAVSGPLLVMETVKVTLLVVMIGLELAA